MIEHFTVDAFRSIQTLSIDSLDRINLIAGDNNCGKTTLLESLMLLRSPDNIANVFRVCNLRSPNNPFLSSASPYESFLSLFPQSISSRELGVRADTAHGAISCHILGEEHKVLLSPDEMLSHSAVRKSYSPDETEADAFSGQIDYDIFSARGRIPLELTAFSRFSGALLRRHEAIPMVYLSPIAHLQGNLINSIIKNDGYKELCIKALQLFDPDITDMLLLKSPISSKPVEYLRHRSLGVMPLSSYGDGLKKALALANAVIKATDGVLLIDEIETSLHKKYYDDIFQFIVKACCAFHVQVFITTHSLEAIDGLLATQNYDQQKSDDAIRVITLKRTEHKNYARVLSGREVAADREAFGLEVRL